MALTAFQRNVCRLLAERRKVSGESYVAGGVALNELTGGDRISRDIDLFHDTLEALALSWADDRALLESKDFEVEVIRERPSFVEAVIRKDGEAVILQWTHDSAFRFFPLVEHPELGLALHAFDLATNKILALVGRLEVRDWIDAMQCDQSVQPLGMLVWAACGKDPGWSPSSILEQARRGSRYSRLEIETLDFEGRAPDAADLSVRWKEMLSTAEQIIDLLPAERVGTCVLDRTDLFQGDEVALRKALGDGTVRFHEGSIGGAFPRILDGANDSDGRAESR